MQVTHFVAGYSRARLCGSVYCMYLTLLHVESIPVFLLFFLAACGGSVGQV